MTGPTGARRLVLAIPSQSSCCSFCPGRRLGPASCRPAPSRTRRTTPAGVEALTVCGLQHTDRKLFYFTTVKLQSGAARKSELHQQR